jgi:D-arginine dehydrogenase
MYRRDGLRAPASTRQACTLVPCLDESQLVGAVHDLDAMDIDVAELHQGFLRGMARAGARLRCGAELSGAEREVDGDGQGLWTLVLQDGSQVRARAVVNAAGAWADAVARLCGARPLGIEPRAARPSPLPHPRARTSTAGLP